MWQKGGLATWLTLGLEYVIPSGLFITPAPLPLLNLLQVISLQSHSHGFHSSSHETTPSHHFLPVALWGRWFPLCFWLITSYEQVITYSRLPVSVASLPSTGISWIRGRTDGKLQKVNRNLDRFCGALLQSSSKIFYFLIFLLIFVHLVPQELSQFYCIACFDTWGFIFSIVLEVVFFASKGSRGKKLFSCWTDASWFSLFLFRFCYSLLSQN